jgi:hypothetical protein
MQASPSKIERAQGRPGAGRTHGPPANKKQAASPQVQPNHPAFPARWLYGFLRALPGDHAWLPPSPARRGKRLHDLDACIGASGPHDFSVRDLDDRLTRGRVHRIPQPTFVTIAKRPSPRPRDGRKCAFDLPDGASASACGKLARRANCAWFPCTNCPSGSFDPPFRVSRKRPSLRGGLYVVTR